jgi:hypothetical protein
MKRKTAFVMALLYWICISTIAFFVLITATMRANAQTTSHTSFHVPDGLAHNTMHQEGCTETKTVVVSKFTKTRTDKDTFTLVGANYEVRCLDWENASIQLSWSVPTSRENGEPLAVDEIAGYLITYTVDGVANSVDVAGGTTTSYTIDNVTAGVWEFTIQSIDTTGLQSIMSDMVTTIIN